MYMAYTTNPKLPRLRMATANLVLKQGWSTREAARYSGYNQSTIVRWVREAKHTNRNTIPTLSSRPFHHPRELQEEIVSRILKLRGERSQCAEILHYRLKKEGAAVSLSSVKRVLKRHGISRYSRWKKWHQYPERPLPAYPGAFVELDSMREGVPGEHLYLYAMIDLASRWGMAATAFRANSRASSRFVIHAQKEAPFKFQTLQTDHGSEFSKWFTKVVEYQGVSHRHSRVRTPTDNAHVERFIQTLQRECLSRVPRSLKAWSIEIPEYLHYYNTKRPHMALGYKTPEEMMRSY